ncbi:cytochrome P450 [Xylariaceae sp. FL1272]|nr:cytochrome P450 [Xylariaceae sp. FL1272]
MTNFGIHVVDLLPLLSRVNQYSRFAFNINGESWTIPVGLVIVAALPLSALLRPPKLRDLPIVGAEVGEWFPLQRAKWRNYKNMKEALETAYHQHSDRACVLPIAGAQNFVHLPKKELQWFLRQPDSDISVTGQIIDGFQFDYTLTDPRLVHEPIHMSVVSGPLTKEIGILIPEIADEVRHVVDEAWGTNVNSFSDVGVYETIRHIICQATNRVFIGAPLCRNRDLLDAINSFTMDIPVAATLLHYFPRIIRPLVAPLITLPNRIHTNRALKYLSPEINRRLNANVAKESPNDFLQWSINQGKLQKDPYFARVNTLGGRILINNFTSIHASSFIMTHTLLDLAASNRQYIDELRDEITSVLAEHDGKWTKSGLAAMVKVDSTIREAQRLNTFILTATNRKVVNPNGIITPSGAHIPYGTMVCGPAFSVFHDPSIYPDPETFKPFRFIGSESDASPRQDLTKTSVDYTPWGHGRHACVGRYFASTTLKIILAYIILSYDFAPLEKRPPNTWLGANRLPPMEATIGIKRRKT